MQNDLDGIEETSRLTVGALADLHARVANEGEHVAFDPEILELAAIQRSDDPGAAIALRAALKALKGFPLTRWEKALDASERTVKRAAKERARREEKERARAASDALDKARAEASAATARARATAAGEVALHHAEHTYDDDSQTRVVVEPGRTSNERPGKRGEDVKTHTLAGFSAVIVRDVFELDHPSDTPRRSFDLSVMFPGDTAVRRVDGIPADEFRGMLWPESRLGARAVVNDTGRRDDLRVAIQSVSAPVEVRRHRFTGWTTHNGASVYLHTGGAIGAGGAIEGLRSEAPAPVDRFDLSAPGVTAARGIAAVLDFLAVKPATVVVPLVAAAFRAPMGPSRLTVHVSGRQSTGKSVLAGLTQQHFGRAIGPESLPASWADGSTSNGISRVLSRVGDAVCVVDDLRFSGGPEDGARVALFDKVVRAHFNRASPLKLTRDRTERHEPASRCTIVSTGEQPPRGHSTRSRIVCVELKERPSPDLGGLMQRAAEGELAAGMAQYIAHLAPTVAENVPRLDAMEREACARWGLGVTDRAAGLFGALALGAEGLLRWLRQTGAVAPRVLDAHEALMRAALLAVAMEHGEGVEAENPARRFLPMLTEALLAGDAHVKEIRPDGKSAAPTDHDVWGWRTDGSDGPRHQGRTVGWLKGDEVFIDPGVALDVVRARAARAGAPVPADVKALVRDLHAAGLLARTDADKARPRLTVRARIGAGITRDLLVFSVDAFGAGPVDDASPTAPRVATLASDNGADFPE